MAAQNATIDLFSALPPRFSALLFASAKPVHLIAGEVLFVADDPESFLPLRGRVAVTLLELAEHFGETVGGDRIVIRQKFKQPDLAAMAGIARENLNRILADWKRRKLVSQISGYYCLESKSALQSEARL